MATLELLPLLFIFIFMFAYTFGAFGIVHSAIKNSIGARQYAFETFRNRANLIYFRDLAGRDPVQYSAFGNRLHGVMGEGTATGQLLRATERSITMGITTQPGPSRNDDTIHIEKIPSDNSLAAGNRNTSLEASPAWIMVAYGICLNVKCGDQ